MNIKKISKAINIIKKYDSEAEFFQEKDINDCYFTSSFDISPNKMNVKDVEKLHDEGWLYNKTLGIWLWTEDEELIQHSNAI